MYSISFLPLSPSLSLSPVQPTGRPPSRVQVNVTDEDVLVYSNSGDLALDGFAGLSVMTGAAGGTVSIVIVVVV